MSAQPKPMTPEPYPTQEERDELTRYGEPQPEERCHHQWIDYGTLTLEGNPKLYIESCVRCGVQRKKRQPKSEIRRGEPTGQRLAVASEWTVERLSQYANPDHSDLKQLASAINAELEAEREACVTNWLNAVAGKEREIAALDHEIQQLRAQLAAAQATIKKAHFRFRPAQGDTTALDAAIAEAQRPLVDALKKARETIYAWHGEVAWPQYQQSPEMKAINSALAKVGK